MKTSIDMVKGLDNAPRALQKLLLGENSGKVLVEVTHDQPTPKL